MREVEIGSRTRRKPYMGMRLDMFHDAEMTSVSLVDPNGALLSVKSAGREFQILLKDVSLMRLADFGLQNVISRFWCSLDAPEFPRSLRDCLVWASSSDDSTTYLSVERMELLLESITSGQFVVVGIVPSVGAELVAMCRSFEVLKR